MPQLRTDTLDHLLADALAAGIDRIGQVQIESVNGGFLLCHVENDPRGELEVFNEAFDAQRIALFDDQGRYRPLKTAPNLRHGWLLKLASLRCLRQALDCLYPAALGNWRAYLAGNLAAVPVRETVNRQTGMYRITGKISTDQACWLRDQLCKPGCMRKVLWSVEPVDRHLEGSAPRENSIPLLCVEICSLYVAAARKVVKGIPLDQIE